MNIILKTYEYSQQLSTPDTLIARFPPISLDRCAHTWEPLAFYIDTKSHILKTSSGYGETLASSSHEQHSCPTYGNGSTSEKHIDRLFKQQKGTPNGGPVLFLLLFGAYIYLYILFFFQREKNVGF